jgi:hypothetical protein
MATAFVNAAMTYLGNDLYTAVENWEDWCFINSHNF